MAIDFTIGMAVFDNFDEVFFTVQSLRFHHQEVIDRFEIVLIDNNPGSLDGRACEALIRGRVKKNGRYIAFPKPKGSCPPRQHLFDVARGRFVVCIDSHVLLEPGALKCLADYFDENPDSDDLLHGPLVSNYGPQRLEATHMLPRWRSEMFGTWAVDDRGKNPAAPPFEIPQHGLGLFAARRESWLRFPETLVGFSGGEGYIHEKYRQAGRRVLCLPGVRWIHKFARPHGIPHRPSREDKIKNHARGWMELGVDLATRDGKRSDDPLASMAEHYVGGGKMSAPYFEKLIADAGFPGYRVTATPKLRGITIGPTSYGSYRMRGRPVAEKLGFREFNSRSKIMLGQERFDVCFAVKCGIPPIVRKRCKRVVWEPLDLWWNNRREARLTPGDWIAAKFKSERFDEIIVSTIPMEEAARKRLPAGVKVHLLPHHADARVGLDWFNSDGPIVYAGAKCFVSGFVSTMTAAAELIGKKIVFDHDHHAWRSLRGAALVLAPRLASRSSMNLSGKPTVKLANAAQAGIPALTTPDPANDLYFDVRTLAVEGWSNPVLLAETFTQALGDSPSDVKFPAERWINRIGGILCK